MKYKEGDKVRVRKDLKVGGSYCSADKKYSTGAVPEMLEAAGKVVTIDKARGFYYRIKEFDWSWTDEMFEESPKFKIGDRVRVLAPTDGKTTIVGRIGTIIGFIENCNQASIEFDENIDGHDCSLCGNSCKDYYGWNCNMDTLELVTDSKIVITTDGKTTTAKLYDGKKFVKSAEAKCSPDDKFDFERGAIIAFSRLTDCDYRLADEAEEEKPEEKPEPEKEKLLNTKFRVIEDDETFKKGHIYEVVDGRIKNVNHLGLLFDLPVSHKLRSIEELHDYFKPRKENKLVPRVWGPEIKIVEIIDEADEVEKPKFTKKDLKTGMFVLMQKDGWGVIVDDKIIYKDEGFDRVSDLDENLCLIFNRVEAVVEACSFSVAETILRSGNNVLWRRSNK